MDEKEHFRAKRWTIVFAMLKITLRNLLINKLIEEGTTGTL